MKNKTMRRSSVVLLSAFAVLALITILMVGLARIAVSRAASGNVGTWNEEGTVTDSGTHYDIKDFRGITFIGNWKVDLEQGDEWRVDLEYPGDFDKKIRVEMKGDHLILDPGLRGTGHWNWKWWEMNGNKRFSARIVMPELDTLNITGATDLEFDGFSGEHLHITISGAGNIEGDDGQYRDLRLTMSGAGNVDMHEMDFEDAQVILSGAGNVSLRMNGGILSGNLSGFGNIEYYGRVSEERVNISGFGKVRNVD